MRRTSLLASVLLPVALIAAGCGSSVPHAPGPAGPVTPSPARTTISVQAVPRSSPPSVTTSPPSRTVTSRPPTGPLVLGPDGLGPLKLHMTSKKASATGLIDGWREGLVAWGCRLQAHLLAGDNNSLVGFDDKDGVEVIVAYEGISTPQGIHLGSTKAQVIKAYPDWTSFEGREAGHPQADGRGDVFVPGNHKAVYEIVTAGGRVTSLTMYSVPQYCFG